VALAGRSGVKYAYRCPHQDCEFTLEANDDAALERRVARHDAREHRRKFDRARFEDRLEVS
jgi:predicted small metal-binding protein